MIQQSHVCSEVKELLTELLLPFGASKYSAYAILSLWLVSIPNFNRLRSYNNGEGQMPLLGRYILFYTIHRGECKGDDDSAFFMKPSGNPAVISLRQHRNSHSKETLLSLSKVMSLSSC